jgi:hypothetical protein
MRSVIHALAVVVALAALNTNAFAAYDNDKVVRKHKSSQAYSRKARVRETHDDVRANALDPGGDYKAYPSWARAALSPKGDNGVRK